MSPFRGPRRYFVNTKSPVDPVYLSLDRHLPYWAPLNSGMHNAILESLSVGIVLTLPSCRLVFKTFMKSDASLMHRRCGRYPSLERSGLFPVMSRKRLSLTFCLMAEPHDAIESQNMMVA